MLLAAQNKATALNSVTCHLKIPYALSLQDTGMVDLLLKYMDLNVEKPTSPKDVYKSPPRSVMPKTKTPGKKI